MVATAFFPPMIIQAIYPNAFQNLNLKDEAGFLSIWENLC